MTPAAVKPRIPAEVVAQIDVRVGTIEQVDDVASSRKLVRLTVDFGDRKRVVLAVPERPVPNGARAG